MLQTLIQYNSGVGQGFLKPVVAKCRLLVGMLFLALMLSGCSEEHPDDRPGAVNNPYPEVTISGSETVQFADDEDELTYSIPVILSRSAPVDGEVRFRFVEGSALSGRDFEIESSRVAFAAGERQTNITVRLLNDSTRKADRQFRIELTGATHATLGANVQHNIILTANEPTEPDSPVTLNIPTELAFVAPPSGQANFSVVIPFSAALANDGSVEIRTVAGTAREGEHFQAVTGENCTASRCRVAAGKTEFDFFLPLMGDVNAADRSFRLQFLNAEGFELPESRETTVTLSYGETATPELPNLMRPEVLSLRMPSAERERIRYPIVVPFDRPLVEAATLEWQTVENTAVSDIHFVKIAAIGADAQEIHAGAQEWAFEIEILHDANTTENLQFEIQLMHGQGINLPENRSIPVEIVHSNNEGMVVPTVAVPSSRNYHAPVTEPQDYIVRLPLSEAMPVNGSVGVSFIDESARRNLDFDGQDGVIEFPLGSKEVSVPFTLLANADNVDDRTFRIELHSPNGVILPTTREVQVRIISAGEPSPLPTLSLAPSLIRVPSPTTNEQDITLYFELSHPLPNTGSVTIRSRNGSAAAGIDFVEVAQVQQEVSAESHEVAVTFTLLPSNTNQQREFELVFSNANQLLLPANRAVTVQIDPQDTAVIPTLRLPSTNTVQLTAPDPDDVDANKSRRIVLPFSSAAPLAGAVEVYPQDQTAVAGTDYDFATTEFEFTAGAHEIVIEFDVEPVVSERSFELLFVRGENVNLADEFEARIIRVVIVPFG